MAFKRLGQVSLITLSGRVLVPFRMGGYQEARLDRIKGQADLLYRNGVFYLAVTLEVPTPEPDESTGTLGIDLGIVNLATDSEGETWSSEQVEKTRQRFHTLRQRLQKRGTQSAKRHLKKLSGKANRKNQASFVCQSCGFAENADCNAALNISRAAVMQPIVASKTLRNNRTVG